MNSRDLLLAIAGTDAEYTLESERFSSVAESIRGDRKRKRRAAFAVGAAAVLCAAAFGIAKLAPRRAGLFLPPDTSELQQPDRDRSSAAEHKAENHATAVPSENTSASETAEDRSASAEKKTEPPASTAEDPSRPAASAASDRSEPQKATSATETSSAEKPSDNASSRLDAFVPVSTTAVLTTEPPIEPPAEPTESGGGSGTPGAVYTRRNVSFAGAREAFGHLIVACAEEGFIGYQVGIVSRNGDIDAPGAFCLNVTYTFTNGSVSLTDQDRWSSSSASTLGERVEYRGRTFYVLTPEDPAGYGDQIHIGYYPTRDNGIAYQAFFDDGTDVYAIMDLMISVEL